MFSENNRARTEDWQRMYRHKQIRKQRVRREVSGLLQHSGEKDVYAYVYAYTLHVFRHKTLMGKKEKQ